VSCAGSDCAHRLDDLDESGQGEGHEPTLHQGDDLGQRQHDLELFLGCAGAFAEMGSGALFGKLICLLRLRVSLD